MQVGPRYPEGTDRDKGDDERGVHECTGELSYCSVVNIDCDIILFLCIDRILDRNYDSLCVFNM